MVPAAAVIPSLLAYVKFVAFKKLVVELMRSRFWLELDWVHSHPLLLYYSNFVYIYTLIKF